MRPDNDNSPIITVYGEPVLFALGIICALGATICAVYGAAFILGGYF